MSYLLRGILVGIIFGVPGGAIGALTVQRTFHYGRRAGLLTGLGSSCADSFYAFVGAFGITLISDFIARHETAIHIAGGSLILFMGIRLLLRKEEPMQEKKNMMESAGMCLSSFLIGMTNPATIFIFLLAFSWFGVAGGMTVLQKAVMVCGVFLGTYVWWGVIATVVPILRQRAVKFKVSYMNRVFGTLLCLLGTIVFIKCIWGVVRPALSESREASINAEVSGRSQARKTADGREEADCLFTEEKRRELEEEALWAAGLTKEQCQEAVRLLGEAGCVGVSDHTNMENYEEVLAFYDAYVRGNEAEVTVYQVNRDGTLTALTFACREGRIQTCYIGIRWQDGDTPEVTDTVVRDIAEIRLTEKGYLIYAYESAPAHSVLRQYLRVKPLSDRCRELTEKYVCGLSYVNYNVLVTNWDEGNAEDILMPCMFEDIYRIDTGENLRAESGRIPADEYERIMTGYFPVTKQQVREKCGYDKSSHSYPYEMILGKQYPPFGEVVDYTENADGTLTLYVDGVWPDCDSDCAFVNRLTVRPFEDGTFRYLSNAIEKWELDIPENQAEKGYDLPVEDREREEAEKDCFAKLQLVRDLFPAYQSGDDSAEISDEQIERAAERIAEDGSCVIAAGEYAGMKNYERMEAFLERAAKREEGEEILYKISRSGMIGRQKFTSDGRDLYVISAVASCQSGGESVLAYLTRTRIEEWRVTEKGWFCYQLCVPEYPEVTEVVDGSCMVRVVPMTVENREMSERCVLPVAYKGNNLFCCDWDAEHMEELDYNGLYEYLYQMKYGEIFPVEAYRGGIPEEEFESLMAEYLPVTGEELRRLAVYDGESRTYAWEMQEYSNDAPVFFSAAVPEVTDIRENEDGTVTLRVDAVCEMLLCDDAAITHEVRVRFEEDGSFQYLGNRMIYCGENGMPEYRKRIR